MGACVDTVFVGHWNPAEREDAMGHYTVREYGLWSTVAILDKIERLQNVQKTVGPKDAAWHEASRDLRPLFAEMARREP